jgi:hypothetical protein
MPPADPVPRSEHRYEGLCPAGPLSAIGSRDTIDLLADRSRKLPHTGPAGREMLISCGAALFGLRLAIREMGYPPDVQLLPDPAQTTCSPRCAAAAPITPAEQQMLTAMPYQHTRRGPSTGDLLLPGPAGRMQHEVIAEGCTLVLIDQPGRYQQLSALVTAADRVRDGCRDVVGEGLDHRRGTLAHDRLVQARG